MNSAAHKKTQICALLNEFLYLGYRDAEECDTISDVIRMIENNPEKYASFLQKDEFRILKEAEDVIGGYEIVNQSWDTGKFNSGTYAATFVDPATGDYYVTYRGTSDGEWIDNGQGMAQTDTAQQREASAYFDYVVEHYGLNNDDHITVTGHSKGGNKSQYVTLSAKYREYIDECFSLDGQGFSPEAIRHYKQKYGEEAYNEYIHKMFSVCGEDDYVNPLGIVIIPKDHRFYIHTPAKEDDMVAKHSLNYFFALMDEEGKPIWGEDGRQKFGRDINGEAEREVISLNAESLSEALLKLPQDKREDASIVIMQIIEMTEGQPQGLDGKTCTVENVIGFLAAGVPTIVFTLLTTPEGQELLMTKGVEIINGLYEELGPVKFAATVSLVIKLLPAAIKLGVKAYVAVVVADLIIDAVEKLGELAVEFKDFLIQVGSDTKVFLESWLTGKSINNPAKTYVAGDTISCSPNRIRSIISRLYGIQNRLSWLEYDMDTLRKEQDWYDLVSKIRVGAIDFLYVGRDNELARCITYLENLNNALGDVEHAILAAAQGK